MNILITGANGFIGKYFTNRYNEKYNIQTFSFRTNSFNNLDLQGVQTIVHLSALVHQMGGASKDEYENINVVQTLKLALKAKENGVKHFIFMSSVKVYGEESRTKYNEFTQCLPKDDYGKSKLQAELELKKLEDENFTVSIIRTPIVYGYGVKANIKNLVSLVSKISLLPFANTANKRSMVYVGNLCYLIDILIEKHVSGIFLASDDISLSTTKFIKLIANELDKNIYLIDIPFFKNILYVLKPSFYKRLYESLEVENDFTKKTLDLRNPYSLNDGIKYMIHGEIE